MKDSTNYNNPPDTPQTTVRRTGATPRCPGNGGKLNCNYLYTGDTKHLSPDEAAQAKAVADSAPAIYPIAVPDEVKHADDQQRQTWLRQQYRSLVEAPNLTDQALQFRSAYCAEFTDESVCASLPVSVRGPTRGEAIAVGSMFVPWARIARGIAQGGKWLGSKLFVTRAPQVLRVGELKLPAVPKRAVGTPTKTGKGLEYAIPRGTPEISERVASIRIMDAVTTGKHVYPNGYAVYMNAQGQRVNPLTGRMIHDLSDPFAHIPLP